MAFQPARRRTLLWLAAAGASGLALHPGVRSFASDVDAFVRGPAVDDIETRQLTEHVHIIESPDVFVNARNRGMMVNVTFVLTDDGVVVIDSGSSVQIGEMAIRMLRRITAHPVIAIFVTHHHGDHWLGNHAFVEAFGEDLPIYAHPYAREAIEGVQGRQWASLMERWTEGATLGTRIFAPNRSCQHGDEFRFGDVTLRVHHHGIAHTPGDCCFEIVEDRVTHLGDVAMDRRIANMNDGSFAGSIKTLRAVADETQSELWIPGHGTPSATVLRWNLELFEAFHENAKVVAESFGTAEELEERLLIDPRVADKIPETRGWASNFGRYASLALLEAEQDLF